MADQKTRKNTASVGAFLKSIADEPERKDALALCQLMEEISGDKPAMWGSSIVGFGRYHYKYESGRDGHWFSVGFSPRKAALTVYIMAGFENYGALMQKLGKYKTGKACLYIKQLSDVDREVLRQLIAESIAFIRGRYPATPLVGEKPGKKPRPGARRDAQTRTRFSKPAARKGSVSSAKPAARKRAAKASQA